jgi:hypothetical protein
MRSTRNLAGVRSPGVGLAGIIVAEFKRAVAADQRYEDLKRSGSAKLFADLPRAVFDEFYSFEGTTEALSRQQSISLAGR